MLHAFRRHHLLWRASMDRSEEPVMRWAVFTLLSGQTQSSCHAILGKDALDGAAGWRRWSKRGPERCPVDAGVCHHLTFCSPQWALWSSSCWELSCWWRTTLLGSGLPPCGPTHRYCWWNQSPLCHLRTWQWCLNHVQVYSCRWRWGGGHASLCNASAQGEGWGGGLT